MKRLPLLKPTVILMVGIPGAGKSYFARRFSEKYDMPCVSSDRLRSEMFSELQYTPAEQNVIHSVADYMTDELLRSGRSFIVDGLLGNVRTQRLNLQRRAREHGFGVLVAWVQVDEATARSRSLKRNLQKADDKYNPPMPDTAFTGLLKQLTPPTTESHVVISGKHTFPTQKVAVLRKLPLVENPGRPRTSEPQPVSSRPSTDPKRASAKVITPTPTRRMGRPGQRQTAVDATLQRPEERRISISDQ